MMNKYILIKQNKFNIYLNYDYFCNYVKYDDIICENNNLLYVYNLDCNLNYNEINILNSFIHLSLKNLYLTKNTNINIDDVFFDFNKYNFNVNLFIFSNWFDELNYNFTENEEINNYIKNNCIQKLLLNLYQNNLLINQIINQNIYYYKNDVQKLKENEEIQKLLLVFKFYLFFEYFNIYELKYICCYIFYVFGKRYKNNLNIQYFINRMIFKKTFMFTEFKKYILENITFEINEYDL